MSGQRPPIADLVPAGAFAYPIDTARPTRWFGFLLLPEFTLLAFSAALDPLRIANQLAQKPLYGWVVLSSDGRPVRSSSAVDVTAHGDLTLIEKDLQLLVCSGNHHATIAPDPALAALRRHVRFGGAFGGVCTGASTLARAGLLDGRRFTLHWENQPGFREAFPDLEPAQGRYEIDGLLMTCGGGAAATEMMISVIAEDYGRDLAVAVADMCLNGADPEQGKTQRSSIGRALDTRNPKVLAVMRAMYANIDEPVLLDDLAAMVDLSRRQLERHFRKLMGETPATVYRNVRLDRARALLAETDMTLMEVAIATGFNSQSLFSRRYRERFGVSPSGRSSRDAQDQPTTLNSGP